MVQACIYETQNLTDLVHDLVNCVSVLRDLGHLKEVDTDDAMSQIAKRFKGKLSDEYDARVHAYTESHGGAFPGIEWLQSFLQDMLRRSRTSSTLRGKDMMSESQSRAAASHSFQKKRQISLTMAANEGGGDMDVCPLCDDAHSLRECQTFLGMSVKARSTYIRDKRRCYACLKQGHRMSECWQCKPCGIEGCRRDHSYLLHFITSRRTPRGTSSHEMGVRTSSDSQGIKRFGDWRTKTQDNKRQRMNVNPM